jgi:siroheme synthase
VRYGTRAEQTVVRCDLAGLAAADIAAPATIVVGAVAAFDFSPVAGRTAGTATADGKAGR